MTILPDIFRRGGRRRAGTARARAEAVRIERAFTLVEILIVTLLLSILAMVALPQIQASVMQAKESQLVTDLKMLRRQIEAYALQHRERLPHLDESGQPDTANLIARLTQRTSPEGKLTEDGVFGPYMPQFPANPYAPSDVAAQVAFGTAPVPPRDGTTGWYYCTENGLLSANTAEGGAWLDVETAAEAPSVPEPPALPPPSLPRPPLNALPGGGTVRPDPWVPR